jgi:sortase (surface protein transpeptidase)
VRPAVAGLVLGLALAVGVPVGWALTRPPAAAGVPVVQAVQAGGRPSEAAPPASVPVVEVPVPARLAVPALGVDAAVDAVGVRPDGQLALPEDVDRVGWYRFGPAPGGPGSAVLAGHVDSAEQGLGALAPLREVAPGDEVQVTDAAGGVTRWRVVGRELIEKTALPLDTLFSRTGPARLVLITCGGPFRAELHSYRDNVVVVAEPIR